jgi:HSP20 family molecular chaperone IbpA
LVTSGSPRAEGSVGVGDYYLVTDNASEVPEAVVQDSQVALDVEGLDEPVWDYWILRVSLRLGSSIPALGLRVDGALPKPELEWIRPGRFRTNWGVGIFLDRLPGVRLKPWNSALASEFTLTLEDGDGEIEIAVPGDGEVKSLPARCPDSGYLAIRRRNLSREIVGRLAFGAIPSGCHIYPPTDVLRTDDTAQIALELPSGVSVEWSVPVARTSSNVYEIAAHERRLEGVLRFESCSMPFNLRLPRAGVAVELDGKDQSVLWTEFSNRNYALRMELPAGVASTLFVAGEETFYPLLNQPSNARAWVQKVPLVHFRDAVLVCPCWAGELILRLRTRDSDLSDINTGCYLVSAQSLARELLSLPTQSVIFHMPAVGELLLKYRNLVARPSTDELPIPSEDIPADLSTCLRRLRYLASVLDGPGPQKSTVTESDIADLDLLGIWLDKAIRCARAGLSDSELSAPPPYDLIAALPVPRWVKQITALIEELRQNSALVSIVEDFRLSFGSGMSAGQSALCGRQGGMDLWHAVNSYRLSLKDQMPKERDLVVQLRRLETIISDAANDSVVRSLAQAFRFMNYYRLGRRAMLDTAPFVSWPPLLGPLRTTLNALRAERTGQLIESVWPPLGVGLAEISPTVQDTELERRLGRPSLAPTNEFKNEIVNQ